MGRGATGRPADQVRGDDLAGEEQALGRRARRCREPRPTAAVEAEDFTGAMAALASLRGPIDAFFDKVTVNDPDPAKRSAPAQPARALPRRGSPRRRFLENRRLRLPARRAAIRRVLDRRRRPAGRRSRPCPFLRSADVAHGRPRSASRRASLIAPRASCRRSRHSFSRGPAVRGFAMFAFERLPAVDFLAVAGLPLAPSAGGQEGPISSPRTNTSATMTHWSDRESDISILPLVVDASGYSAPNARLRSFRRGKSSP